MFLVPPLALQIDLFHDNHHLGSPLRTDWIKAKSRRFFGGGGGGKGGGGKQAIKFARVQEIGVKFVILKTAEIFITANCGLE